MIFVSLERGEAAVLGSMPVPQTIALLRAMPPAKAAGVLLGMPPDRIGLLLAELPPAELTRLFPAVGKVRRPQLLAAAPPDRMPLLLGALPLAEAAELVAALPADRATRLVGALPEETRARLAAALPDEARTSLYGAMPADRAGELASAVYERRALAAVARTAPELGRPGEQAIVVDVLGGAVQVCAHRGDTAALDAEELHELVRAVDWDEVTGLLVLTGSRPADRAVAHAGRVAAAGYPVELLEWADDRDDGLLKRALVRLGGPPPGRTPPPPRRSAPGQPQRQAQWTG